MHFPLKITFVAVAACVIGMASTAQSFAQSNSDTRPDRGALSQDRPNSVYEPNGSYNSEADFARGVNGVPCGIDCERRAREEEQGRPPH
jgi:hypothetical protein